MDFASALLTKEVLAAAAGIVALLWGIGMSPIGESPDGRVRKLRDSKWWRRLLPLMPLALGVAVAYLPGVVEIPTDQWGAVLVQGLWVGFVASHGRKLIKRLVVDRLEDMKNV